MGLVRHEEETAFKGPNQQPASMNEEVAAGSSHQREVGE